MRRGPRRNKWPPWVANIDAGDDSSETSVAVNGLVDQWVVALIQCFDGFCWGCSVMKFGMVSLG